MMRSTFSLFFLAFLTVLVGKVAALDIVIGGTVGNITADQFLAANDPVRTTCNDQCNSGVSAIQNCATNSTCLCDDPVVKEIVKCQQCMFTELIHLNKRPEDPRAGQTSAIAAYALACTTKPNDFAVNKTLLPLAVPPDWNGPFGQGLDIATTVITVIAATILGSGMIAVVNTM